MNDNNSKNDYASNTGDNYKGNRQENYESIFNIRVKAGSRRTYFFDVKTNRKEDYFIVITERRKRLDDEKAFDKNKIFLYKEDFNKVLKGLADTINHVKTDLMPNFDFSVFDRENKPNDNLNNDEESKEINYESKFIKNIRDNDEL